jgi:hypothetical protein
MLNRRELVKLALVSFAGLCLVVLLIYAGYLYSWSRSHCDLPGACGDQIPFDANLWRESASLRDPQRIRMIDDLRANVPLAGEDRVQVLEMLGPPERSEIFQASCDLVYWLGPERSAFSADDEWLCLKLDGSVVTGHEILRD